eukprot:363451-Chlamydomonas_euryale.AAC.10
MWWGGGGEQCADSRLRPSHAALAATMHLQADLVCMHVPCSFLVTLYTSPLTLQVLGNFKGVIAAVASVFVFVNPVTAAGVNAVRTLTFTKLWLCCFGLSWELPSPGSVSLPPPPRHDEANAARCHAVS